MFFLMILAFIVLFILFSPGSSTKKTTCDILEQPHKWTRKGEEPHTYLVCDECNMLPGGQFEESDNYSN
jgi:hypothetical protein